MKLNITRNMFHDNLTSNSHFKVYFVRNVNYHTLIVMIAILQLVYKKYFSLNISCKVMWPYN